MRRGLDAERARLELNRFAAAGVLGGLALAAADFASSQGYLHRPMDRALLAIRLAVLLGSIGGLLAMAAVTLDRAARPWALSRASPRRAAPLPVLVCAAPLLILGALRTFEGRLASSLPGQPAWTILAALLAIAGAYAGLRALRWGCARGRRARGLVQRGVVGAGMLSALLVASGHRTLYPRQYPFAHGGLAALAFVMASVGAFALVGRARFGVRTPATAGLLAGALCLCLASLPADHDGRAALLSPRAASTRPLMLALAPPLHRLAGALRSSSGASAAQPAARPPRATAPTGPLPTWPEAHVFLITVDALRADHLGAYDYPRGVSPRIDALAAESVVFERAWAATPRSSWSLCALMTGVDLEPRYRVAGGARAESRPTLAESLGRYAAGFYPDGIFFHDGEPLEAYRERELGFSRRSAEYADAGRLTEQVLAELDDLVARGEPPAFFWVHYFDVHEPYRERSLGDAPVDRYDGEIRNVDRALAGLLDRIDALSRDALVVLTADHGEEFLDHGGRFHGGSLYEEQLRVPLIVRAPGVAPSRVSTPVSLLDIAPTLLAAVGAREAEDIDGVDLRSALGADAGSRPAGSAPGERFVRAPIVATEGELRAVLHWPLKLIEDRSLGEVQLFDLERDPRELRSQASERPDRVEALQALTGG